MWIRSVNRKTRQSTIKQYQNIDSRFRSKMSVYVWNMECFSSLSQASPCGSQLGRERNPL